MIDKEKNKFMSNPFPPNYFTYPGKVIFFFFLALFIVSIDGWWPIIYNSSHEKIKIANNNWLKRMPPWNILSIL